MLFQPQRAIWKNCLVKQIQEKKMPHEQEIRALYTVFIVLQAFFFIAVHVYFHC